MVALRPVAGVPKEVVVSSFLRLLMLHSRAMDRGARSSSGMAESRLRFAFESRTAVTKGSRRAEGGSKAAPTTAERHRVNACTSRLVASHGEAIKKTDSFSSTKHQVLVPTLTSSSQTGERGTVSHCRCRFLVRRIVHAHVPVEPVGVRKLQQLRYWVEIPQPAAAWIFNGPPNIERTSKTRNSNGKQRQLDADSLLCTSTSHIG